MPDDLDPLARIVAHLELAEDPELHVPLPYASCQPRASGLQGVQRILALFGRHLQGKEWRCSRGMRVSPRLVAASYILELSSQELQQAISQEIEENPATWPGVHLLRGKMVLEPEVIRMLSIVQSMPAFDLSFLTRNSRRPRWPCGPSTPKP